MENLYITPSVVKNLPSMVKNELAKMTAQKQEEFIEEYERKAKSTGTAYLCWVFIFLPFHYGYLKKWWIQILFWITFGGILIWWVIDIFRIPGLVQNYNKDVALNTMRNLKAIS